MSVKVTVKYAPQSQWKKISGVLTNLAIRGGIVLGAIWFPTSKYFLNYITLAHWYFWFTASVAILGVLAMMYLASKASNMTLNKDDDNIKALRACVEMNNSWTRTINALFVSTPSLFFVGIYMGDWSLLTPMLIGDIGLAMFGSLAKTGWEKLPKEITEEPETVKAMADAAKDPITKALEDLKLKKSQEEKTSDAIVDKLMDDK